MAKDPAFLFYVNDWAGGTQWMTRLQRGAYLDLLLYQVNNTSISLEEVKSILGDDFGECWPIISRKFTEENGFFYNKKMRETLEARARFSASRAKNRRGKTKEKCKKEVNNTSYSSEELVGNGNENENINENKKGGKGGKRSPVEVQLPWDTESFRKAWEEWKEYRRQEHGFKYKTATSQSGALSELFSLSMGNETNAIEIMRQSEANGWKGFFKLKDKNDGKTATRSGRVVRGTDYDDLKPGEIPISDIGRRSDP